MSARPTRKPDRKSTCSEKGCRKLVYRVWVRSEEHFGGMRIETYEHSEELNGGAIVRLPEGGYRWRCSDHQPGAPA